MGTHVLTQGKVYMGKYDLSGDLRSVGLTSSVDLVDAATFGQTTHVRKGGLRRVELAHEGLWNGGTGLSDDALFSKIGVADEPVTVAGEGADAGEAAYLFKAVHGQYEVGASIGEMLRFSVGARASGAPGLVRGTMLFNGSAASTSTGTKYQVGAATATQAMYAALHVLSGTGTLDVIVQSDADSSAGSETNRITFTQATGATSEWKSVVGAITDTWWRVSYTITTGPFVFAVSAGII